MRHQALHYFITLSILTFLQVITSTASIAGELTVPNTFTEGQVLTKENLNDNFTAVESEVTNNHNRITSNEGALLGLTTNSLGTLTCGDQQIAKYDGTNWVCASDEDTFYTQGSGISISGNVISATGGGGSDTLASLTCNTNQIAKYNGTAWICSADTDTSYTSGSGINISGNVISATGGGGSDTLAGLACNANQIAKYNGTAWICSTDIDTTYTSGTGISISGTTITATQADTLADLGCTTNQIARYNGTAWICGADTDTTYTSGSGISISGTVISASQADTLSSLACTVDQIARYNGSAWVCSTDQDTVSIESGVDYTEYETISTRINISTTLAEVERVVITSTSPGFVIVTFSAHYRLNHKINVFDSLEVDISDSANPNLSLGSKRFIGLSSAVPTQELFAPLSMQKIFPIAANISKIFYVYAKSSDVAGAGNIRLNNPQTYALFVPNRL